jgi:hypothetical protein
VQAAAEDAEKGTILDLTGRRERARTDGVEPEVDRLRPRLRCTDSRESEQAGRGRERPACAQDALRTGAATAIRALRAPKPSST